MTRLEIVRNELAVASAGGLRKEANRLDGALGGNTHKTVGQVFNMGTETAEPKESPLTRLQHRETDKGTSLIQLDSSARTTMQTLRPGSIVTLTAVGKMDFTRLREGDFEKFMQMFRAMSTVATVIEQTDQWVELFGYVREPREVDKANGKSQGLWGEYGIDTQGTVREEKTDAMELLARLFHGKKGNEATNVMSTIFSATTGNPDQMNKSVVAEGCESHDNPRGTIGKNFLTGYFIPRSIHITAEGMYVGGKPSSDLWALEAYVDPQGLLEPLDHTNSFRDADESPLYVAGLESTAAKIARTNPQGFGRGTPNETVVEALLETATALPEYVDGKVGDAIQVFRRNLGLRK